MEDPLLTELHHTVVRKGDYEASEEIVTKAIEGKYRQKSYPHAISRIYLAKFII